MDCSHTEALVGARVIGQTLELLLAAIQQLLAES